MMADILLINCRAHGTAIEPSEGRDVHCHPYRAVVIEPVSTNRLLNNGSLCVLAGDFWQILAKAADFGD